MKILFLSSNLKKKKKIRKRKKDGKLTPFFTQATRGDEGKEKGRSLEWKENISRQCKNIKIIRSAASRAQKNNFGVNAELQFFPLTLQLFFS